MRYFIKFSVFVLLFSCNPKLDNRTASEKNEESISYQNQQESFKHFFNLFIEDIVFQKQRIDDPIRLIILDGEREREVRQKVEFVSFKQQDWDVKIDYKIYNISTDTTNVILEGVDTGVHVEHLFVKRGNNWYLYQIKNLSD